MDSAFVFTVILAVLLVVGAGGYLLHYLSVNVLDPAGKGASKKTARILARYGRVRRFKTLTDITLTVDGKTATIETMLIGYFGIFLVHTCGARGGYYGTLDGETWIISEDAQQEGGGGSRKTIPNPILEQQRAMALLRSLFSKNKLYNIPMENVVYLSSKARKSGVYITHSGELLLPGKLPGYLDRTKFDRDAGLDVGRLAELVAANSAPSVRDK